MPLFLAWYDYFSTGYLPKKIMTNIYGDLYPSNWIIKAVTWTQNVLPGKQDNNL